ncbi:MAG: DUF2141 domain-containing protein [Flavobacteriaceae bacterium]|nr:DUF2141 domain-containing protein [Flavobacteriaceae bacterium]
MRTILFTFLAISSGIFSAISQEKETINLTIEITVTKYNKGEIYLALYNGEENFLKKIHKGSKAKVKNGKAILEFKEIEKGTYAFSLFHDVNGNGKLDKNFLGIPKEPYAFSNNEKGSFGPPKYKKAQFSIQKNNHLKITIK